MSFSKLTMVSFDGNLGVALEKKLSFFQSLMLQVKNEYGPHLWKKKDSNEMEQLFQFIIHQIDAGLFDDVVFTYDNFSVAGDHIKNGFNVLNQMGAKSGRLASNSYWVTYGLFDKKSHKVKNSILKNGQISGVGKLINETIFHMCENFDFRTIRMVLIISETLRPTIYDDERAKGKDKFLKKITNSTP